MYSTCLFCHTALGRNESIEHFPVGKRLAFDASKGRLWVVCHKCQRWCLSPLDERWEAIEEAERAYRDAKKRLATDQVGLARLRDGTDLIRIGAPLRPEFAAWRYGDTFGRRRKKHLLYAAAASVAGVAFVSGAAALGALTLVPLISNALVIRQFRFPFAKVRNDRDELIGVMRISLPGVRLSLTDDQQIRLRFDDHDRSRMKSKFLGDGLMQRLMITPPAKIDLSGARAEAALIQILPGWNGQGGSAKRVATATADVESLGSVAELIRRLPDPPKGGLSMSGFGPPEHMTVSTRLALEMMLHEDSERRALEGELHELEQRWKEAEEIAGISDSLFFPAQGDASSD